MGLDDPSRIVFTNPVARRIHLQVKALADVFVDTPQYNGHGTATDALWAGVLGCVCVCVCARACVCVCVCVYIHTYMHT
jgi:predicted O-linked N-acetylglucosamine transferase (SPINDLY family)